MRRIHLFFVVVMSLLMGGMVQAQNAFFPYKAGTKQLYVHKDSKGKVDSYTRQTVKEVKGSGGNMLISYVAEVLDKDKKPSNPPTEVPCTVVIKDGVMTLDMNQMFASMMKDPQMKVEITGVAVELPADMKPGQSLKDANMTMSVDMGIMKMQTDIQITDGKCLAIEDVSVAAGTFKCHKITQTVTTTVMRRNVVATTISWYAPGIGIVKTESYDDKNKLTGTTELVSIVN